MNQLFKPPKKSTVVALVFQMVLVWIIVNPTNGNTISLLERGKLIDSVCCDRSPGFSYALYLPSYYNASRKWPIIFVFDPMARGSVAITNFTKAAEQFGYIVVGSNNSKNGFWDLSFQAANQMFGDTRTKFRIDSTRIYTSGFSGGSRVAAALALNTNKISGVIGCGAGFPIVNNFETLKQRSFVYVGLVGINDMNYLEMLELEKQLTQHQVTSTFRIFDGGHQWPEPNILYIALEWLELQAIKKGTKPKDEIFVRRMFLKQCNEADSVLHQGNILVSSAFYQSILMDFSDQNESSEIQGRVDSLENTKNYKKASKSRIKIWQEETEIQKTFVNAFHNGFEKLTQNDSIRSWWKLEIQKLKKTQEKGATDKQHMASRILNWLIIYCYESGYNAISNNQNNMALSCFHLLTMIEPDNNYAYFQVAKANIQNKNTRESLNALSKAIQNGYHYKNTILNDPAFELLKTNKHFKELLTKMGN